MNDQTAIYLNANLEEMNRRLGAIDMILCDISGSINDFHKTFVPTLSKDGDQWCALYGNNIQDGIVGWGHTPAQALSSFNSEFFK